MYWHYLQYLPGRTPLLHRMAYLLVLTGCAIGVTVASETSIGGILILVVAGLLPWMLQPLPAVAWLLGQNVLLTLVMARIPGFELADATVQGGMLLAISLFVFVGSVAAVRQNEARDELRKLNHELLATQACWPRTPASPNACASRASCTTWSGTTSPP